METREELNAMRIVIILKLHTDLASKKLFRYMYAFHLRPRGSNGTVAVRLIVVVWPVRSMHRAAVLVLLAAETSLSGSP